MSAILAPYRDIAARISTQYDKAKASGDLFAYDSTVDHVDEDGVRFEVRVCPALKAKHDASVAARSGSNNDDERPNPAAKRAKPDDPFEGPYTSDLLIGKVGQEEGEEKMVALLNKFSVVPGHFLLVTEEFQPQQSPLHPPHLLHAYLMLLALRSTGKQWMAFYNCGELAGASQKRRHLQFIPVEGEPPIEEWTASAEVEKEDEPFALHFLPYAHAIMRLPAFMRSPTSATPDRLIPSLMRSHIKLLDATHHTIWTSPSTQGQDGMHAAPAGPIAYNFVLTLTHMHMVPRLREKSPLIEPEMSINSLGFAGMLLAMSEEEKERLKGVENGIRAVLKSVGLEPAPPAPEIPESELMLS